MDTKKSKTAKTDSIKIAVAGLVAKRGPGRPRKDATPEIKGEPVAQLDKATLDAIAGLITKQYALSAGIADAFAAAQRANEAIAQRDARIAKLERMVDALKPTSAFGGRIMDLERDVAGVRGEMRTRVAALEAKAAESDLGEVLEEMDTILSELNFDKDQLSLRDSLFGIYAKLGNLAAGKVAKQAMLAEAAQMKKAASGIAEEAAGQAKRAAAAAAKRPEPTYGEIRSAAAVKDTVARLLASRSKAPSDAVHLDNLEKLLDKADALAARQVDAGKYSIVAGGNCCDCDLPEGGAACHACPCSDASHAKLAYSRLADMLRQVSSEIGRIKGEGVSPSPAPKSLDERVLEAVEGGEFDKAYNPELDMSNRQCEACDLVKGSAACLKALRQCNQRGFVKLRDTALAAEQKAAFEKAEAEKRGRREMATLARFLEEAFKA